MVKWSHIRQSVLSSSSLFLVGILSVVFVFFSPVTELKTSESIALITGMSFAVLVWYALQSFFAKKTVQVSGRWYWGAVGLCFFVLVLSHCYPYTLSSAPLGFDTGLYRYEFFRSAQSLPEYVSHLFVGFPLLTDVMSLFQVSLEAMLREFHIVLVVFLAGVLFMVSRDRWGKEAALVSLFLFVISLVQWRMFEMMLFKQLLALSVSLYALLLLTRRSYWSLLPLGFLMLLQPLDVFLVGLAFVVVSFFQLRDDQQKRYFFHLIGVGVVGVVLVLMLNPEFWEQAWMILKNGFFAPDQLEFSLKEGVFFQRLRYAIIALPVLVLGMVGVAREIMKKQLSLYGMYAMIVLVWVLLGFFFYKRLQIQLDLILILFAGPVVMDLFSVFRTQSMRAFLLLLLMMASLPFYQRVSDYRSLVSEKEFQHMVDFCENLDEGQYVMASDGRYGPWLRGYCLEQRVIAPGQFEYDLWTEDEWLVFWRDPYSVSRELFARYDDVVYVFVGDNQQQLDLPRILFRQVGERWYEVGGSL